MKIMLFMMMCLVLTACVTENKNIYTNKIKFHKDETKKVLYAEAKAKNNKVNFADTEIAENKLKINMFYRLNEYNKSFIPIAQNEIKKVQKYTVQLKARISESNNQRKQIEELEKQIKESNLKIKQLKPRKKNESSRN